MLQTRSKRTTSLGPTRFWEPEIGEYYNGSQVNLITEVLLPLKGSAEMYLLDTFD